METLNINQKINAKQNALMLYPPIIHTPSQMISRIIKKGYFLSGRYSPSILIPKQHLEFREPKRNPLLIN